jgi:cell division protein FtsN
VFVLGVMVGRRVEARGHVERAHVEAAVDPLAALDRLEAGDGLTFQGALRGVDPKPPEVDQKIAAIAAAKEGNARPPTAHPDEPAAGAKVDKVADARKIDDKKVDKTSDVKKADDKKTDDKRAEDKRAEDKRAEDKKRNEDKKADDKKADKAEDRPHVATDKSDEPKKSRYTLQLSSFQDRSEAESYMQAIKSAGFSAFLSEGEVEGRQFFRVRLGSYRSLDAANDAKSEFEHSTKKSALVTKL